LELEEVVESEERKEILLVEKVTSSSLSKLGSNELVRARFRILPKKVD